MGVYDVVNFDEQKDAFKLINSIPEIRTTRRQ